MEGTSLGRFFITASQQICDRKVRRLVERNRRGMPRISCPMFTQLNPPIPLDVIGKGSGYALAVIDYGQEHNLIWVTALDASGEIWCAPNPSVRMQKNWTMGRVPETVVRQ